MLQCLNMGQFQVVAICFSASNFHFMSVCEALRTMMGSFS